MKNIYILIFVFFSVSIYKNDTIFGQQVQPPAIENPLNIRKEMIAEAEKYLGRRYKTRVGKQIMDCSGFTKMCMQKFGFIITRSSVTQIHEGVRVKDIMSARPGDIIVFKGSNARNRRPGHVGLVHHISNDTIYFIHSSVTKGITIDHLHQSYYKRRFLQIRDVIGDK
jgi:lipoprotein Spr